MLPSTIKYHEMSKSPILHFVHEQQPEPSLLFIADDDECAPSSPSLVFMRNVSPPPEMKEGSFHLENVDFCAFVLSRGQRKGEMCGKISTHSLLLHCEVPACIQHLGKYEEISMLSSSFLSPRSTYSASYAEYDSPVSSPVAKPKKQKQAFSLDSIPKAIDRSNECVVCLEKLNPLILPCGHTVCFECTTKLNKETCPMCRKSFKKEDVRRL